MVFRVSDENYSCKLLRGAECRTGAQIGSYEQKILQGKALWRSGAAGRVPFQRGAGIPSAGGGALLPSEDKGGRPALAEPGGGPF